MSADPTAVRFEHGGSLSVRALRLLERGPATTAEVAGSVMGLRSGDAGTAARAVFALLGADPRFVVSGEGVWSLVEVRAAAAAVGKRRLREEEFVVVDVETTGGSPDRGDRVTEVAAVRVSGGRIAETYASLVNPQRRIPSMIVSLTGITDTMVRGAPLFAAVSHEVARMVEGSVFVAHNAAFDWRFVTAEMERATGTKPAGRQLCTVRLARKLLPQLPSRSLDGLATYFGLEIESRHRALDDALATAEVLIRFIAMLEERDVETWEGLEVVLGKRAARKARRSAAMPRSMEQA